ncbi:MAG: hypothetical protein C0404_12375 [Verrucomicrobia bacterium]|nr:hypothetical protein [Verrucomicrobiota bacterium]
MTKGTLIVYPAPVEEVPATDFGLTVNGQPVFTHQARVSAQPMNQVWPGYQRPLAQTEIVSFAAWDMTGPVEVVISSVRPVREARVRPTSLGIQPVVEGNTLRFTLPKPGQVTVEVNGTHRALHLFGNPPEKDVPDPKDPNVRYFGPGVHCPGVITMASNQTVYLAGGAVVYGAIVAEKANHITIRGRGILDGSKFDRADVHGLINTLGCNHVAIEGIILRDPNVWTVIPVVCQHVHIRNVKLIGLWRYNTDGIDFVNSQHCIVEDSFVRSFDDSIVFKGLQGWAGFKCSLEPVTDIQVRRCVIWNDWGRALEIGAETVATEISDLLFEDCDIIHSTHVAMDVQNGDRGHCHNLLFRNIRVELDDDLTRPVYQKRKEQQYDVDPTERYVSLLIVLEIISCMWSKDSIRGRIDDIHFKNIDVHAWATPHSALRGFDSEHLVQNVTVENLRINGRRITDMATGGFTQNEFVHNVGLGWSD